MEIRNDGRCHAHIRCGFWCIGQEKVYYLYMYQDKKSVQLGMGFGSACHKLRVMLLFSMAEKLGRTTCVRCNKLIESADDFSIEHIVAWQDLDVALFWDLNNIGFSHRACNYSHARRMRPRHSPEGMAWCWGHQDFLPHDRFAQCRQRSNGLQRECKECRSLRQKKKPWRKAKMASRLGIEPSVPQEASALHADVTPL